MRTKVSAENRLRSGRWRRLFAERLEDRLQLSIGVYGFHYDSANTGWNAEEELLTPASVRTGDFGKLFSTEVDGQVYAQPLVAPSLSITGGPNTTPGAAGVQDVVIVATQHNSLYAIDASSNDWGRVLWHRSFIDTASGYVGSTPGTNINNTLQATSITTVPAVDTGSTDINPEIGITGTPVMDAESGTIYVVVKSKEVINGSDHWVQRLHAVSGSNGTDRVAPYLIGDTSASNVHNTSIYVYGDGIGHVTDPYYGTGKQVVQFNALRQNQRAALSLVNEEVYVSWASHGDNGEYHGWIAKWDVSDLAADGLELSGVLNTSPNGGLAGIWQGAGGLGFEPDGQAFYAVVGNGPVSSGTPLLDSHGFPVGGNFYEAALKIVADTSTNPRSQNTNGWGLKVSDYFMPYNTAELDLGDIDFGSVAPLVLPDSAGIPGHPHLLVTAGKEGKIYVLDRDNLGKFAPNRDRVVNAVSFSGPSTPPKALKGVASVPAFYQNNIYFVAAYRGTGASFSVNYNGSLSQNSRTSNEFGYLSGSPVVSSLGDVNGIVWTTDRNSNRLRAFDAKDFRTELWNSEQATDGSDRLGLPTKFGTPAVANGVVFVGTVDKHLVAYGLKTEPTTGPETPAVSAKAMSSNVVQLSWTDGSQGANKAAAYAIFVSTDNIRFERIGTAAANETSFMVGGLSPSQTYYFGIQSFNARGASGESNVATVRTKSSSGLDFSGGFYDSTNALAYNGSAAIVNGRARLTNLGTGEAGSVFSRTAVDIGRFSTVFDLEFSTGSNTADGVAFVLQRQGATALGAAGGNLGYGPQSNGTGGIANSAAVKFDLYDKGAAVSTTGLNLNGARPVSAGSQDLSPKGIDFHSGHVFRVNMSYDGFELTVRIQDRATGASATQVYTINLRDIIGGSTAFVGFTGGTGRLTANQDIRNWTFSPGVSTAALAAAIQTSSRTVNANLPRSVLTEAAAVQSIDNRDRPAIAVPTQAPVRRAAAHDWDGWQQNDGEHALNAKVVDRLLVADEDRGWDDDTINPHLELEFLILKLGGSI